MQELLQLCLRSTDILQEQCVQRDTVYKHQKTEELKDSKALSFNEYRWLLQCYGLIATFYNAIGHQKRCESAYVKYV